MGVVLRRLAAGMVDMALFMILASLVSAAAYTASGGVIRAFTFLPADHCRRLEAVPESVAAAAARALEADTARSIGAVACRRTFLGLESGRFVTVALQAQQGETLIAATVFQPVDRSGRPVEPVAIDWPYALGFLLLAAVLDSALGGTPGKQALGLRVLSAAGGRAGFLPALARNLIVHAWLVAAVGWLLVLRHGAPALAPGLLASPAGQAHVALLVSPLAAASLAMLALGRPDPLFDRWSGLRVTAA